MYLKLFAHNLKMGTYSYLNYVLVSMGLIYLVK